MTRGYGSGGRPGGSGGSSGGPGRGGPGGPSGPGGPGGPRGPQPGRGAQPPGRGEPPRGYQTPPPGQRPVVRPPQPQSQPQQGNGQMQQWDNPANQRISQSSAPQQEYSDPRDPNELVPIDTGKRAVALVFDFIASYLLGVTVTMLPFVNRFVSFQMVMIVFFLIRDFLFEGRGIGKNLMGLRVVDSYTGGAPTILQSVLRNITILAPFVVLQVITLIMQFVHIDWLNDAVMRLINIAGMGYVLIVLPLESYRAYSRPDSLRYGDDLAKTAIVESSMDFSKPFPK